MILFIASYSNTEIINVHKIQSYKNEYLPPLSDSGLDYWPMLGHDAAHTSVSSDSGPETNNTLFVATVATSFGGICIVDGKAYVTTEYNHVKIFDEVTGELLSDFSGFSGTIQSTPAVDSERNRLYFATTSGLLYCLNATTGAELWTYDAGAGIYCSPTLANDRIYIGGNNKKLMCIKSDGVEDWSYTTASSVMSSPAVADDKVFFGSNDDNFYCVDASDGSLEWVVERPLEVSADIRAQPAVADGRVFWVSADNDLLHCYNIDGGFLWNFSLGTDFTSPGPAVYNNKVYVGSSEYISDGKFYCIDAVTGTEQWNFTLPFYSTQDYIRGTAAVSDGKVYIGFGAKKVYCLDAETGDIIWDYTTEHSVAADIAIANGVVYVPSTKRLHAFGSAENSPPSIPQTPEGVSQGFIEAYYTFETSSTDPDGDTLSYFFDWGDGTFSDWIGPYNSSMTIEANHAWTEEGDFDIKVKSKDLYGAESDWSPTLSVTITSGEHIPQLVITAPSSVKESTSFDVTITSDAIPIIDVDVEFTGVIEPTNSDGQAAFTAPEVDRDTDYTIIATLEGYTGDTERITVLNQIGEKGWIYGIVYSDSSPLENVKITISSGDEKWVAYSDEKGRYVQSLTPDTYTVEAIKQGYKTSTEQDVIVLDRNATGLDFLLEKELKTSTDVIDSNEGFIESYIDEKAQDNELGVKLNFAHGEKAVTTYYSDELSIELNSTEEVISFTVGAEDDTNGTILVIKIGEGVLEDLDNLNVTYDGVSIYEFINIEEFFDLQGNTTPGWMRFLTKTGLYIFVRVPYFSEHTITISSIIEEMGGITTILAYILISLIILFIFISPRIVHIISRKKLSRKP